MIDEKLKNDIVNWSIEVFPDLTEEKQTLKLQEEVFELENATTEEEKMCEMADVFIVAIILAIRFNSSLGKTVSTLASLFDIQEYVEKKMIKNKARVWKKVSNGTYHHEGSEEDE